MSKVSESAVEQAIANYRDPNLETNYVEVGWVDSIDTDDAGIRVKLRLGYPAAGIQAEIEQALVAAIQPVAGGLDVAVEVGWEIKAQRAQKNLPAMAEVSNIIAVASGKGGVGKSTTAANLALALLAEGARVGILDADIYGPSQALMLGIADGTRPQVKDEKYWIPIEAHGLQAMSMGFLVDERTPMVWRGPMVTGALQQLLSQSLWRNLDYLIVDMPPGTGDIQLTLAQKVPVAGAVVVTTPQDIALLDAKKGIEMFRKVEIPVLGIVENMAVHLCSQCGHAEHIFGAGGGDRIAQEYQTDLLGSLPLTLSIREQADGGLPSVAAEPDGDIAQVYRAVARRMAARLAAGLADNTGAFPNIQIADD